MFNKILAFLLSVVCFFAMGQPNILPERRGFTGQVQDKYGVWPGAEEDFPTGEKPWWVMPRLFRAAYDIRGLLTDLGSKTTSLLVLDKGKIVYEYYADTTDNIHPGSGTGKGALRAINSGTKSIVSALVGIAIEEGRIGGVDDKVIGYFPGAVAPAGQESKHDMTVGHLLTMTSGLPGDFDNLGSYAKLDEPFWEKYRADSARTYFLEVGQKYKPGRAWGYSSLSTHVLGGVVAEAVGVPLEKYAEQKLFGPLGITDYFWYKAPDGLPQSGGGLHLNTHDMLRFGWLYLNNGNWNGTQVVPADWVAQTPPRAKVPLGYGRLFWAFPYAPFSGYGTNGYEGQYIDIFPSRGVVIVRTGTAGPADQFLVRLAGLFGIQL